MSQRLFLNLCLIATVLLLSIQVFADNSLAGKWRATLKVPNAEIPLVIHLNNSNNQWSGTLDTPAQGGFDIPMSTVQVAENKLTFEIASMTIHYEGKLSVETGEIEGNFVQGSAFPLNFQRVTDNALNRMKTNDPKAVTGTWSGIVKIPGSPLTFVMHVSQNEAKLEATAESPDQGVQKITVHSIELNDGEFTFAMNDIEAVYKGLLLEDGKTIAGTLHQKGYQFPLTLKPGQLKKNR